MVEINKIKEEVCYYNPISYLTIEKENEGVYRINYHLKDDTIVNYSKQYFEIIGDE